MDTTVGLTIERAVATWLAAASCGLAAQLRQWVGRMLISRKVSWLKALALCHDAPRIAKRKA
jgi:hypothetical protein